MKNFHEFLIGMFRKRTLTGMLFSSALYPTQRKSDAVGVGDFFGPGERGKLLWLCFPFSSFGGLCGILSSFYFCFLLLNCTGEGTKVAYVKAQI